MIHFMPKYNYRARMTFTDGNDDIISDLNFCEESIPLVMEAMLSEESIQAYELQFPEWKLKSITISPI